MTVTTLPPFNENVAAPTTPVPTPNYPLPEESLVGRFGIFYKCFSDLKFLSNAIIDPIPIRINFLD